ncbi:hypothetical protein [Serratia rubidaea]|uniref:hypothetical protein n=1 Tax=Serratia rubidaea TaxID=61652 RepID=UPI00242AAF1D|nr:hypothetical protein [Serratia rubidaea]MCR0999120.1 hypothetical protein [Serratia rubidaea]
MLLTEKRLQKFALWSLFVFTFSGVVSLISVKLDNPVLRIWKEAIIIGILLLSVFSALLRKNIALTKLASLFLLLVPAFLLYFLFSINTNTLLVAYQIKNDVVPLLFAFSLYIILSDLESTGEFYKKMIKLVVVTATINSFFIYIESMFPSAFMATLQIEEFNNSGGKSGIRLDNALGSLRAMGTMTTFINAGTLTFFGIVCVLESGFYTRLKKWVLFAIMVSALILTTYKTAMIALAIYLVTKVVYTFFKRLRGSKMIYLFSAVVTFLFMGFVFNTFTVYDALAGTKYKPFAYNSIYLRSLQHSDVIKDMENRDSFYTGLGVGTNGTMGPNEKLKLKSKALDSTYIYLMSNYGFLGALLYVSVLLMLLLYFCSQSSKFDNIAIIFLFYTLGADFFINNTFSNFPCNVILYSFIIVSLLHTRRAKRSDNPVRDDPMRV